MKKLYVKFYKNDFMIQFMALYGKMFHSMLINALFYKTTKS